MKLTILGSGTSIPLTYRASPSFLLLIGWRKILFDVGPGTLRQLAKVGIDHREIEHIFISHFHPDHTADLVHFLFVTRNLTNRDDRKPFIITGPFGLRDFIKNLNIAYPKWLDVPDEIMRIEELDIENPEERSYIEYIVRTQPLSHTHNSLAYRFSSEEGKNLVFSGDTGFCDEIINLAKDCDLLVLECALPDEEGIEGHLTPTKAGKVAALAGTSKLILVHFYPEVLKTDIAKGCRKEFHGDLILGRDLLEIVI